MAASGEIGIRLVLTDGQVVGAALDSVGQKIDGLTAPAQRASAELTKIGMSANATAAAMRSVPAQFTDIITSLQGGQSPMTVLMQQGGQLKDMFGGVGAAAKALGSYAVGLIGPWTAAGAALATVGVAAYQASEETKEFQDAILLSGNAAGVTTDQLRAMAAATGGNAEALTAFVRAGDIGIENLENFTQAAVRMERYLGVSIEESVKNFEKLGEKPLEASLKLNESTHFLTLSVYEQITALTQQGKTTDAATLAQQEFHRWQTRIGDEAQANLGPVASGWDTIKAAIGGAWKALKDYTAGDSLAKQIATQQTVVDDLKSMLAKPIGFNTNYLALESARETLKVEEQRLFVLKSTQSLQAGTVLQKKEDKDRLDAQIAWDALKKKHLSDQEKMELAIAQAIETGNTARKSEAEILDEINHIIDKGPKAEKSRGAVERKEHLTDQQRALESYVNSLQKQLNKEQELTEAQKARNFLNSLGVTGQIENVRKLVLGMADQIDASRALTQAEKEHQAALDAVDKAGHASVATLEKQIAAQELHNAEIGQSREQIELAKQAQLDAGTAALQIQADAYQAAIDKGLVDTKNLDIYQRQLGFLKEELALRARLSQKLDEGAQKEAAYQQQRMAQEEWKKGWEETNRLGREVFTTWAMDGANMAQKIGDTLKKALLSAVYEATLKPLVFQLYTSVMGSSPPGDLGRVGTMISGTSGASSLGSAIGLAPYASAFGNGYAVASGGFSAMSMGAEMFSQATTAAEAMTAASFTMGAAANGIVQASPYIAAAMVAANAIDRANGSVSAAGTFAYGHNSATGFQTGGRADFIQTGGGGTTKNSTWFDPGEATSRYMSAVGDAVTKSVKGWADAIGLSADAVDGYTQTVEASIGGLDPAGIRQSIDKAMAGYGDAMIKSVYGEMLAPLAKQGEAASATLQRLGTDLATVNAIMDKLGGTTLEKSLSGAQMAEGFITAAGSLDKLQTVSSQYYDGLYSAQEKTSNATKDLDKAFTDLGLSTPKTAAELRRLVESQDLSTAAGRTMAVSLMSLAPAIQQVTQAAADARTAMLKDAGVDQGSLSSVIKKGLVDGNLKDIGGAVSDTLMQGVQDALYGKMADRIAGAFTDEMIAPVLEAMGKGATLAEALAGLSMDDIKAKYQRTVDDISSIFSNAQITSGMGSLKGAIQDLFNTASYSVPKGWVITQDSSTGIDAKADGGYITGPGTGTSDDVLLWGSNGEFVVKTASAQKYGSKFLNAVNDGTYREPIYRASGGYVWDPQVGSRVIDADLGFTPAYDDIRRQLPGMANFTDIEIANWQGNQTGGGYNVGPAAASGSSATAKDLTSTYESLATDSAQTYINVLRAMGEVYSANTLALSKATEGFDALHVAMYREIEAGKTLVSMRETLTQAQKDYAASEVDLLKAQGDTTGAAAKQREIDLADVTAQKTAASARLLQDGLSENEKSYQAAIVSTADLTIAQYDLNKAREKEIAALNERKGLQDQLDDLLMTPAQLLAKQRATLDPSNWGKFDELQAAKTTKTNAGWQDKIDLAKDPSLQREIDLRNDLANATDETTKTLIKEYYARLAANDATAKATAKADALTKTNQSWQDKIDLANDPSRQREIDQRNDLANATDETTKALIKQYYAQLDVNDAAAAAAQAANALASSYADLKRQIENANIELARASGDQTGARELETAMALREHAGDEYYASLYRELQTVKDLTAARQTLNNLTDNTLKLELDLKRAKGENLLANAIQRSADLKTMLAPAASAKVELDRSNMNFSQFISSMGLSTSSFRDFIVSTGNTNALALNDAEEKKRTDDLDNFFTGWLSRNPGGTRAQFEADPLNVGQAGMSAYANPILQNMVQGGTNRQQDLATLNSIGLYPGMSEVVAAFKNSGRTDSQKTALQGIVDTKDAIVKAYDLNKQKEAELKIIGLQDEAMKANIDAQKALTDAQKSYADVLKSTIGTMRDFLKSLDGAATPTQNLAQARTDFRSVADKAAAGDTSAYKDLTPAARNFLDLSKNYSKTIEDYQRDEARVRATLNAVIRVNQNELDKLPAEIAKASDPTKEAWTKLQEAVIAETNTSVMLTALGVDQEASKRRLRTAEETLADRYIETIQAMPNATDLQTIFNDALTGQVDETVLPAYTAFDLGDIWGKKIAGVLPQRPMTNMELNELIAEKFPGMLPSDFLVPLTTAQLSELVAGKFPTLTNANLISSTADVSGLVNTKLGEVLPTAFAGAKFDTATLVNTKIGEILPANFAGAKFDAQLMMQTAINQVAATLKTTGTGIGTVTPPVDIGDPYPPAVIPHPPVIPGTGGGGGVIPSQLDYLVRQIEQDAPFGSADARVVANLRTVAGIAKDGGFHIGDLKSAFAQVHGFHGVSQDLDASWGRVWSATNLQSFDVGTNLVPHDMVVKVHKDEAIVPAPFNPERFAKASGNTVLVEKIQALTAEVARLQKLLEAGQNAIKENTAKTARMLTKLDEDGIKART